MDRILSDRDILLANGRGWPRAAPRAAALGPGGERRRPRAARLRRRAVGVAETRRNQGN